MFDLCSLLFLLLLLPKWRCEHLWTVKIRANFHFHRVKLEFLWILDIEVVNPIRTDAALPCIKWRLFVSFHPRSVLSRDVY